MPPTPPPLTVGFDLDMTLIDTAPGFGSVLQAVGAELGVEFPIVEMTSRLGPPLETLFEPYLAASQIPAAGDRFRALYPEHAIASVPVLAGAHEALAAVRRHGGRTVVVTGKYPANAQLHLDHLGLDVDVLEGWVWGVGKAAALVREGASIYVGDHIHDVEGALAAGALSVSVLTGGCTREELLAAGTHVVLANLAEFGPWLEEHLLGERLAALEADLAGRGSVLVAFSGGADSALLLAAAARTLGADRVLAATAQSDALPQGEREPARAFAASLGVRMLTPRTHELDREGYRANSGDRCYFCKAELIETLGPLAEANGIAWVATGTNADDALAGFRPGIRAASERGAITPLLDAGLTKAQIREISRRWGLPTWDKPAAACLSSRIAYGVEITAHRLARVDRAETAARSVLRGAGVPVQNLRVRDLPVPSEEVAVPSATEPGQAPEQAPEQVPGNAARAAVEIDAALLPLADAVQEAVLEAVREAGFQHAEVRAEGFRSGALNDLLADPERWR